MKRRDLLTATPGLLAIPFIAQAGTEDDPIMPHYREWCAARLEWWRWCNVPGNGNWDFPESTDAQSREGVAFEAMMRTPARTMEGIAALAHVIWDASGPASIQGTPDFVEECEHYESRAILALWRSASGQNGLPPSEKAKL